MGYLSPGYSWQPPRADSVPQKTSERPGRNSNHASGFRRFTHVHSFNCVHGVSGYLATEYPQSGMYPTAMHCWKRRVRCPLHVFMW